MSARCFCRMLAPVWRACFTPFRRLSPVPEIYDDLIQFAQGGADIRPSPARARRRHGARTGELEGELAQRPEPATALFRLHVVEADTMEVSSHRVFVDPECAICRGHR